MSRESKPQTATVEEGALRWADPLASSTRRKDRRVSFP